MAKRKKVGAKLLGWIIILLLAVAGVIAWGFREEPVNVTAVTVERGYVEDTVTAIASGTIKPRVDSMVAAEHIGKVTAIPVHEGQVVSKGDLLVELSHAELDAQVELAKANVRVAESRLQQAKLSAAIYEEVAQSRVDQTEAQREEAQSELKRLQTLAERDLISQMELDKAKVALRVAQETETSAIASAKEKAVRAEEVRSAQAALEQAQANLAVAEATREKAFVRAPLDGIVADIQVDVGESVGMGIPLLQLVDNRELYVEAPFDEANAAQIQVGQKARIGVETLRGEEYTGVVEYIPPVVSLNPDMSRTLNVRIRIDGRPEGFLTGMSADVVVLVDAKEDVVYVPTHALVREQFAYVVQDGIAVRREVEPGVGNWSTREIKSGLREGETLITSVAIRSLDEGVPVNVVESLEDR